MEVHPTVVDKKQARQRYQQPATWKRNLARIQRKLSHLDPLVLLKIIIDAFRSQYLNRTGRRYQRRERERTSPNKTKKLQDSNINAVDDLTTTKNLDTRQRVKPSSSQQNWRAAPSTSDIHNMVRPGVLDPVKAGQFIAENAEHVKINEDGLDKLAAEIVSSMKDGELTIPETDGDAIHPSKDYHRAADWVFVADALNFCFWSYTGAEKWTVDGHSGYYALEAALMRAIKDGIDITNPEYYSKISEKELRHLMRGEGAAEIPLFEQRLAILHEVGAKLIEKYKGSFQNCISLANKSALKLIDIVVEDFPCFKDEAVYKGKTVAIYKRVQILVSDLQYFFGKDGPGAFEDLDSLTMFADYRIPQVLMYFGAFSYTEQLMKKLHNDTLLPSGSDEEVEIRGCSIHAVEILRAKVASLLERSAPGTKSPNSATIDYFLWCYRRKHAASLDSIPFHKTLGIYY